MRKLMVILVLLGIPLMLSGEATAGPHLHIKLEAHSSGKFLVGKPPKPIKAPVRFTLHLKRGGKHHVRLVGLGPGRVIHAGIKAKPFKLRVKGFGGPKVHVGPGKMKLKGKHGGRGFKGGKRGGKGGKVKLKF